CEEFGVAAPVGEMREPEVAPGADVPVTVAVINHVHRGAVRKRVILVESGRAAQGLESCRVAALFRVQRHSGQRQVIIAGRWARAAVLAPVAVRGLFFRCEATEDSGAQALPLWVAKDPAGQIDG